MERLKQIIVASVLQLWRRRMRVSFRVKSTRDVIDDVVSASLFYASVELVTAEERASNVLLRQYLEHIDKTIFTFVPWTIRWRISTLWGPFEVSGRTQVNIMKFFVRQMARETVICKRYDFIEILSFPAKSWSI